jgi:hypothetical protein
MVSECLPRVMSSAAFSRLAAAEYMMPDPARQHATELGSYAAAVVQNCAVGGDAGESRQVDSREARMIIAKHDGGRIHEAICREEARASYLVGGHCCIPGGDRDTGLRDPAHPRNDRAPHRERLVGQRHDLPASLRACRDAERAETWGMDRQTLRDWAHRYSAEGLPGLYDRKGPVACSTVGALAPGRFARLTAAAIRRCAARTLGRQGAQAARLSPALGAPAPSAAVVFDGAGYHIAKDLAVREKITLIRLPPRAPELNPMGLSARYVSPRVPHRSLIPRCALHCSASASCPTRPRKIIDSICYTNLPQR